MSSMAKIFTLPRPAEARAGPRYVPMKLISWDWLSDMNQPSTTSFWAVTAQMGMPSVSYAWMNFTKYCAYEVRYCVLKVQPPLSNDPLASIQAGGVQGVAMMLTRSEERRVGKE